jgi:hypothetical protein
MWWSLAAPKGILGEGRALVGGFLEREEEEEEEEEEGVWG